MQFEIYLLEIVNEVYFRMKYDYLSLVMSAREKLYHKIMSFQHTLYLKRDAKAVEGQPDELDGTLYHWCAGVRDFASSVRAHPRGRADRPFHRKSEGKGFSPHFDHKRLAFVTKRRRTACKHTV